MNKTIRLYRGLNRNRAKRSYVDFYFMKVFKESEDITITLFEYHDVQFVRVMAISDNKTAYAINVAVRNFYNFCKFETLKELYKYEHRII